MGVMSLHRPHAISRVVLLVYDSVLCYVLLIPAMCAVTCIYGIRRSASASCPSVITNAML